MLDLGVVKPGSTIRIPFSSFDKDDGSAITMTNFAAADILVYKDGNATERASTAGFTATTDFDTKTGKHLAVIDLADNTTAGFWASGSEYLVAIDAVTIDAVTTGGWIARFRIGIRGAILDTTIATLSTQTSFTLTDGPAEDNALVGCVAYIHDVASAVQGGFAYISAYTGSTKTVTLVAGASYTVAASDNISILAPTQVYGWRGVAVPTANNAGYPMVDMIYIGGSSTNVIGMPTSISSILSAVGDMTDAAATGDPGTTVNVLKYIKQLVNILIGTAGIATWPSGVAPGNAVSLAEGLRYLYDQVGVAGAGLTAADDAVLAAIPSAAVNADAVWDEARSGHVAIGSFGQGSQSISGTAQAGGASTITLAAGASAVDDQYNGLIVCILGGTGEGQCAPVADYVGSTKVATITGAWTTQPDNTSVYALVGL